MPEPNPRTRDAAPDAVDSEPREPNDNPDQAIDIAGTEADELAVSEGVTDPARTRPDDRPSR